MAVPKLRSALPLALRVELARARRWPAFLLERGSVARTRAHGPEREPFAHALARHSAPLRRAHSSDDALQRGKEQNVRRASSLLDGLVVPACSVFSYHHAVGRPSRLRGFAEGLELHAGKPARGVGGGSCQVSNLLYWLALCAGMKITERHRHALDLFPDDARAVPFGCGATVFYNYADLRFENPLPRPVMLALWVTPTHLHGELRCTDAPTFRVEVRERDHRFFRLDGSWMRENKIDRRFVLEDGTPLREELVAHNIGRVMYEPDALHASLVRVPA